MTTDLAETAEAPRPLQRPNKIAETDLTGTTLGRYLLLRRLGKGGMGVVYEGEDSLLNRRVAVKLLPDTLKRAPRLLERFIVEAQVSARLNHPNIIAIYDIGEGGGTFFIVMELLQEQSLGSYLRKSGPLHWTEATRIAADCCSALHVAHCAGLVHRDIKPDNILCSPSGVVKVADFGLVKELQLDSSDVVFGTQEGTVVGSPQFMSPEQCRAEPVDARSDIYSLGATYYCMLTGRPPFGAGTPTALMLYHCTSPTPDPRELVPEIPDACAEILTTAMNKQVESRFDTADEMRKALVAALAAAPSVKSSFLRPNDATQQPARRRQSEEVRGVLKAALSPASTVSGGQREEAAAAERSPPADDTSESSAGQTIDATQGQGMVRLESAATQVLARARPRRAEPQRRDERQAREPAPARRNSGAVEQVARSRRSFLLAAIGGLSAGTLAVAGGLAGRSLRKTPERKSLSTVPSTLKVGILHSLSGTMAGVGRPIVDATLLAIDEINEQGGLLGALIEPVVVDGKTDSETFTEAAQRLIGRDKVITLFGGWHSEGRRGIRQVVEKNDHLLIYPGDYEGLEDSPNVFYLGGDPSQRVYPGLRYFVEKLGHKRFFLLGSSQLDSSAIHSVLHDWIRELGGKVVGERAVQRGELDFGSVLRKISSVEPDLVISTLRGDSNVALFRAWQKREKSLEAIQALSLTLDENMLTLLADVDMTGNFLAASYFQEVPRSENTSFIDRFRKKYGVHHVLSESMEAAYSGVYLWAQAVRAVGSLDLPKIRSALRGQSYEGPGQLYRFDPASNHAFKPFYLARITAGNRISIVEAAPAPHPPQPFPPTRPRSAWEALLKRM